MRFATSIARSFENVSLTWSRTSSHLRLFRLWILLGGRSLFEILRCQKMSEVSCNCKFVMCVYESLSLWLMLDSKHVFCWNEDRHEPQGKFNKQVSSRDVWFIVFCTFCCDTLEISRELRPMVHVKKWPACGALPVTACQLCSLKHQDAHWYLQ